MDLEPAMGVAPAVLVQLAEIEDRVRRSAAAGRAASTLPAAALGVLELLHLA